MADIITFDNTSENKIRLALRGDKLDPEMKLAIETIDALPKEAADAVAKLFFRSVIIESKVALGLMEEEPPDLTIDNTPVYDKIVELQDRVAQGCYFCTDSIDPNATGVSSKTRICGMCALKLANYLTYMSKRKGKDDPAEYLRDPGLPIGYFS